MVKLNNGESVFGDTFPSMVKWWNGETQFARRSEFWCWSENSPFGCCPGEKLSLEQLFSPVMLSRGTIAGTVPWDNSSPGNTRDTLLGRDFSKGDVLGYAGTSVLMMIHILSALTQKYAYFMVCFSTYIFSTSWDILPTCPVGHGFCAEPWFGKFENSDFFTYQRIISAG